MALGENSSTTFRLSRNVAAVERNTPLGGLRDNQSSTESITASDNGTCGTHMHNEVTSAAFPSGGTRCRTRVSCQP